MTLSRFKIDFQGGQMRCAGLFHTEGKLDLCYGSMGRSYHNGVLVESKLRQDYGRDVHKLSRSVQT